MSKTWKDQYGNDWSPMISENEEHSGQFAKLNKANSHAKYLTQRYKRKHRVVLSRTWRNLEDRSCWYVCLDVIMRHGKMVSA